MRRGAVIGVILALLLVPSAGAGQTAPEAAAAIKLSPRVGPPTLPFTVQGRAFGATEVVDITFDLTAVGSATTNGAGSFSKRVAVPVDATPGSHTVTATGETSHLTASAGFTVRTNWPKFHFDAANTGFNPFENVLDPTNVSDLVERWSVPTADGAAPDPVISGGILYVAPADGVVRALNPVDGSLIWSHDTGAPTDGSAPIASGGAVYVANDAGTALALSAGSGQLVWSADVGGVAFEDSVANGLFYVTDFDDGTIHALDASSGATVWSTLGGFIRGNAPLSSGLIYFGTRIPCSVTAFDAVTGDFAWQTALCGEIIVTQQTGAVAGPKLFGQFYQAMDALRASNGAVAWDSNLAVPSPTSDAPALAYGLVCSALDELRAWDQVDGGLVWSQSLVASHSSPAVANGVVYVGTDGGTLRAYHALTGALLWESPNLAGAVYSPAVSDGVVYVSTFDGVVHAFALP